MNEKLLIMAKPEQQVLLVEWCVQNGIPVYPETRRFPYDREYPFLVWNMDKLSQTQQDTDGNWKKISIPDFKKLAIKHCAHVLLQLNEEYTAKIFKDKIVVGCQTFNINIIDELVKAKQKLNNTK